eukprot:540350_1
MFSLKKSVSTIAFLSFYLGILIFLLSDSTQNDIHSKQQHQIHSKHNHEPLISIQNNITSIQKHPYWMNVLNLTIDIRSIVFDDRVQSIYLLSEIPNALQPTLLQRCHDHHTCGNFPYFWILHKTIKIRLKYYTNNSINHHKCNCKIIWLKSENWSFFPWLESYAEKYG